MKTPLPYGLRLAVVMPLGLLSACHAVVLEPSGEIAVHQRNLLLASTGLMLLVVVPVIALTILFAWRYRASNRHATYQPDWDHSIYLELMIWAIPLLIIICLGALTWVGTHLLDPYRPLHQQSSNGQPAAKPLVVDVVALDWKWLFIYPQYGVATVNDLAAPLNQPIEFHITSSTVMNSFYVPALAGQIYAMPGMQTRLNAVINKPGDYNAFSANYSGAGFSGMHFVFHGLSQADFSGWLAKARDEGGALDRASYLQLAEPSEHEPVRRYRSVAPDLFDAILRECVRAGQPCRSRAAAMGHGGEDTQP